MKAPLALIGSSKTDEREFKTVIRFGHEFAIRVAIEDQLPVSETEDIQVEMRPVNTPPTASRPALIVVASWSGRSKPSPARLREIKFGWRVRWPKDKAIRFTPS